MDENTVASPNEAEVTVPETVEVNAENEVLIGSLKLKKRQNLQTTTKSERKRLKKRLEERQKTKVPRQKSHEILTCHTKISSRLQTQR
jgi:hypothetical protein